MCVIQRVSDLPQEMQQRRASGSSPFFSMLSSDAPGHILHENVGEIFLLENVVDGDDIRMRKQPGRLRFAEQTLAQTLPLLRILEVRQPNCLDRHRAAYCGIERFVDDAHRAATQFFLNLIAANLIHAPSV